MGSDFTAGLMLVFGISAMVATIWFSRWLVEESNEDYPHLRKVPKLVYNWLRNR